MTGQAYLLWADERTHTPSPHCDNYIEPYANRLDKDRGDARRRCPLHDNAPLLKSRAATTAIHGCKFEQLYQPPYRHTVKASILLKFSIVYYLN